MGKQDEGQRAQVEPDGSGAPFLPAWHGLGGSGLACGGDREELGLVRMHGFHGMGLDLLLLRPKAEPAKGVWLPPAGPSRNPWLWRARPGHDVGFQTEACGWRLEPAAGLRLWRRRQQRLRPRSRGSSRKQPTEKRVSRQTFPTGVALGLVFQASV